MHGQDRDPDRGQDRVSRGRLRFSGADSEHVLDLAWLDGHFQAGLRNPLDTAIVESGPPRGAGWAKIDEVPFDFQRRRVSVLVEHEAAVC